jgi:C4-dicarboxylate transporter
MALIIKTYTAISILWLKCILLFSASNRNNKCAIVGFAVKIAVYVVHVSRIRLWSAWKCSLGIKITALCCFWFGQERENKQRFC